LFGFLVEIKGLLLLFTPILYPYVLEWLVGWWREGNREDERKRGRGEFIFNFQRERREDTTTTIIITTYVGIFVEPFSLSILPPSGALVINVWRICI
jgi:hypothetical protein